LEYVSECQLGPLRKGPLAPDVKKGHQSIKLKLRIKANISDEQFQDLSSLGPRFSPVYDSVTNGVSIAVSTERIA